MNSYKMIYYYFAKITLNLKCIHKFSALFISSYNVYGA